MKTCHAFVSCLITGFLILISTNSFGGFPEAKTETYLDAAGKTHLYRVQEPKYSVDSPNILIYMHGSAGKEEQGMDPEWSERTFTRLRELMNNWGWVYVCPRDAEFKGLLSHLKDKYRPQAIYLSGASAGGYHAISEAEKNPSVYAGLLLMCPVIKERKSHDPEKLSMPVWIVTGEKDRRITGKVRSLVKKLKELKKSYFYREIAGGHHGTPVEKVDWGTALRFLQEHCKQDRQLACI
jgi:hypothetical protein